MQSELLRELSFCTILIPNTKQLPNNTPFRKLQVHSGESETHLAYAVASAFNCKPSHHLYVPLSLNLVCRCEPATFPIIRRRVAVC